MYINRIVDGKIVECWANGDDLGMMRQLVFSPHGAIRERLTSE